MEASLKLRLEEEGLMGGAGGGLAHRGNTRVSVRLEDLVCDMSLLRSSGALTSIWENCEAEESLSAVVFFLLSSRLPIPTSLVPPIPQAHLTSGGSK